MLVEMFSDIFCWAVNLPRLQILRVDGGGMINDVIMHTAHDVSCEKNARKRCFWNCNI